MREALVRTDEPHVDIRILDFVSRVTGPDLKDYDFARRSILQVVTVFDSRFKTNAIAGAQSFFPRIRDEHHLALDDENKLILC